MEIKDQVFISRHSPSREKESPTCEDDYALYKAPTLQRRRIVTLILQTFKNIGCDVYGFFQYLICMRG